LEEMEEMESHHLFPVLLQTMVAEEEEAAGQAKALLPEVQAEEERGVFFRERTEFLVQQIPVAEEEGVETLAQETEARE